MKTTTKTKLSAAMTHDSNVDDEPVKLLKRIGSTTYMVSVRFSETSNETMVDKLHRLIESEVQKIA